MMTKKNTALKFSAFYTLFIPVVCLLLFGFSNPSIQPGAFSSDLIADDDSNIVIIVDAGHGGTDFGAQSSDGTSEKEITLSMARNIQTAGEKKNVKIILTRSGDEGLTLKERMIIVNRQQADAFISLHINYDSEGPEKSGIECLVSEKNAYFDESKRLAERLMQQFQSIKGISANAIKKSDFYVLRENTIPAIILELGYSSNPSDLEFMSNQKNQARISESIIDAVVQYTK